MNRYAYSRCPDPYHEENESQTMLDPSSPYPTDIYEASLPIVRLRETRVTTDSGKRHPQHMDRGPVGYDQKDLAELYLAIRAVSSRASSSNACLMDIIASEEAHMAREQQGQRPLRPYPCGKCFVSCSIRLCSCVTGPSRHHRR